MQIPIAIFQFLAGGVGGLVRALVGITKSQTFLPADATHQALQVGDPEKFLFQWKYFTVTIIVSIIVGQMSAIVFNGDWRVSLLAGYAGTDLLESLYKLRFSQMLK